MKRRDLINCLRITGGGTSGTVVITTYTQMGKIASLYPGNGKSKSI